MSTSWANDEEWLEALEAFIAWRESHSLVKHIVGGDWDCCWSAAPENCMRTAATKEFLARRKLYGPKGRSTPPAHGVIRQRALCNTADSVPSSPTWSAAAT